MQTSNIVALHVGRGHEQNLVCCPFVLVGPFTVRLTVSGLLFLFICATATKDSVRSACEHISAHSMGHCGRSPGKFLSAHCSGYLRASAARRSNFQVVPRSCYHGGTRVRGSMGLHAVCGTGVCQASPPGDGATTAQLRNLDCENEFTKEIERFY